MAQLMTQASLGQTIAPLHIIGESFGTSNPGQLSWFPAAYSLTVGTFILPAGRLGDLFGHKLLFVLGFLWYGVWSLLAGFSVYSRSSPIFFDICRAFQGIGPAFLLPNSIAILGRTYQSGRRKEMVFSIFGATAPGGFVVGAVFSSLFAQLVWWPWTFWVGGIVCFVCAVLGYLIIPHTPRSILDTSNGNTLFKHTDALGGLTGVAGLVLINFAWNQAPIVGWAEPYIYTLLIIGFCFLAAFAYIESHVARFPLIPMEAMTKDTGFILGCISTGWATFGIWVYYVWVFSGTLDDVSPLLATAHFSPVAISGLCAAITTGLLLHRLGPGVVMCMSMIAFLVGTILIATLPIGQIYWAQLFVAIIVMPWGMDMSFPAANIVLSNKMHHEHQGVAASLVNTVLNYSISLGLGFAGTIEEHVNGGGTTTAELLRGYRGALYFGIGLAGLGVMCAVCFTISEKMEGKKVEKDLEVSELEKGDD
jgi:MFS family permease